MVRSERGLVSETLGSLIEQTTGEVLTHLKLRKRDTFQRIGPVSSPVSRTELTHLNPHNDIESRGQKGYVTLLLYRYTYANNTPFYGDTNKISILLTPNPFSTLNDFRRVPFGPSPGTI